MLELKNVTKRFNLTGNKEDERIALNKVNLKIESGEFVTIIGGNGSGKSTTLNIISGKCLPDEGSVLLNNFDITTMKEYDRAPYFGRVFQDPLQGTAGDMSIIENLEIAYRRGKVHSPFSWGFKKDNKAFFIEELKRFELGLEDRLNQKVGVLSGGQRQALTLLMASLRHQPSYKIIKRDYIRFSNKDKNIAKEEFEKAYLTAKSKKREQLNELKDNKSDLGQYKAKKKEIIREFDREVRKFDLTKQILLLDEHTAALDPKTAKKVLELTDKIVKENGLTTLMVTHNMKDALTYGNRLIMFMEGKVVLDVKGEEKKKLTPDDLIKMFSHYGEKVPDSMIL